MLQNRRLGDLFEPTALLITLNVKVTKGSFSCCAKNAGSINIIKMVKQGKPEKKMKRRHRRKL